MSENLKNKKKIAVILFNLGGPDKLESVRPFLYNLFSDYAIIRLPFLLRKFIALLISFTRYKSAQENYAIMGGKSPLLDETIKQKDKLEESLLKDHKLNAKVFISMRYWHPFSYQTIKDVLVYQPDEIVYLPLYPQFSSTTSASSIKDFDKVLKSNKIDIIPKIICCYPQDELFIKSHIELIKEKIVLFPKKEKVRILFSAHSLPVKIIENGDPYQWQVEQTVKSIMEDKELINYDYKISYQSKVGPIEWLTPSTEDEFKLAGVAGKDLLVVPIAFISEHIETLVELDHEYAVIAKNYSLQYERVKALGVNDNFIKSLSNLVMSALASNKKIINKLKDKQCPKNFSNCPCKEDV